MACYKFLQVIIPIYESIVSYFSHKTFLIAMQYKRQRSKDCKSEHLKILFLHGERERERERLEQFKTERSYRTFKDEEEVCNILLNPSPIPQQKTFFIFLHEVEIIS